MRRSGTVFGAAAAFVAVLLVVVGPAAADPGTLTQPSHSGRCVSSEPSVGCDPGRVLSDASSVAVSPDGTNAYVATVTGVAVFDRDSTTGALTQKAGTAGCIGDTIYGGFGGCAVGTALRGAASVVVSPDGKNVYVSAAASNAVATFDRDPTTGSLTQKPGTAGCISFSGTDGACVDGSRGFGGAITVSPDGANVYVTSPSGNDTIAILHRDATGALTQEPGAAGCIDNTGFGGCADGRALNGAAHIVVAPDGADVYVASEPGGIAIFDRDALTGALTQPAGAAGCIHDSAADGCADANTMPSPRAAAMSADGAQLYVATSTGVVVLDRDPSTGALQQKAGPAGCITASGSGGACASALNLTSSSSIAVSPDGLNAYVTSYDSALLVFDRDAETGELVQKPGTSGCLVDAAYHPYTGDDCLEVFPLLFPREVAVAPDGRNVYVAIPEADAVMVFTRSTPDTTDPTVAIATPVEGAILLQGQVVPADYQCDDDRGVASCVGDVEDGQPLDTATLGAHTLTVTATDTSGNTAEESHGYTVVAPASCAGEPVDVRLSLGQQPTAGPDVILGTPGNDRIDAAGGGDIVCGGGGADVVNGGPGQDELRGQGGNDLLRGGTGNDRLLGLGGADALHGQKGADHHDGGQGRDRCHGGVGRDSQRSCEVRSGVP